MINVFMLFLDNLSNLAWVKIRSWSWLNNKKVHELAQTSSERHSDKGLNRKHTGFWRETQISVLLLSLLLQTVPSTMEHLNTSNTNLLDIQNIVLTARPILSRRHGMSNLVALLQLHP